MIETAPAELVGDIYKNGIYLCGGGSLLRGIDEFFRKEIAVNVQIVDDPLACLVRGTGLIAENFNQYQDSLCFHDAQKYILSFILLAVLFGVYFYQKIYLSA